MDRESYYEEYIWLEDEIYDARFDGGDVDDMIYRDEEWSPSEK